MIIQRGEQRVYLNHELIESVVRHDNKLGKVSYVVTMASGAQTTEVDAQFERFVILVWPPAEVPASADTIKESVEEDTVYRPIDSERPLEYKQAKASKPLRKK